MTQFAQKSEIQETNDTAPDQPPEALAKVQHFLLISAVTTGIAIAAVIDVIGYRVYHAGESGAGTITNGTVFLPKGAHVVSTTIGDGRIVVTLDVSSPSESAFTISRRCSRPAGCNSPPRSDGVDPGAERGEEPGIFHPRVDSGPISGIYLRGQRLWIPAPAHGPRDFAQTVGPAPE